MSNHDNTWGQFQKLVDNHRSALDNTNSLLKYLQSEVEELDINIENLESLLQTDVKDIAEFLRQKAQQQQIPANTKALWISIASYLNTQTNDEVYAISVKGCKAYDDEDNFWNKQVVFQPQGLISLDSVTAVDLFYKNNSEYEFLDWILPLAITSFVINEAMDTIVDKKSFLKNVEFLEMTIGYTDGDFIGLHPIFVK